MQELVSSEKLSIGAVDKLLNCFQLKWDQTPEESGKLPAPKDYGLVSGNRIGGRVYVVPADRWLNLLTECEIKKPWLHQLLEVESCTSELPNLSRLSPPSEYACNDTQSCKSRVSRIF